MDLSYLITGASEYALIRELSTTPEASFRIGKREVISSTTNRLIKDEDWDIELQKTGLTTAAGYCMVSCRRTSTERMLHSSSSTLRISTLAPTTQKNFVHI